MSLLVDRSSAVWIVSRKSTTLPDLAEEVRESWVVFKTSDVTRLVRPVASEGDPQGALDVSRAIGKARALPFA